MRSVIWRWKLRRALLERCGLSLPFSRRRGSKKILLLSEHGEIPNAQIFPFFLYAKELADRYHVELRQFPLRRSFGGDSGGGVEPDAIVFQSGFDLKTGELESLIERISSAWPHAQLAYFDWFAPADLRYAKTLNSHVAAYVKKQVFRDLAHYDRPTLGDTNLTDFYAGKYNIDLPQTHFQVPAGFEQKLVLAAGFECSPVVLELIERPPKFGERSIDLHARMSAKGPGWYGQMRREALAEVAKLQGRFQVTFDGFVARERYFAELRNSKLCFSPFGYGEVCWRDFEAMSTGALLLKPDMAHLRLSQEFFRANETYIPLSWDLSDLAEKVEYYVRNASKREEIARNAFELMSNYYRQKVFLRDIEPLWGLLGVRS